MRDRHHRFFLALVEAAAQARARGRARESQSLARLGQEHDNLEVALNWGHREERLAPKRRFAGMSDCSGSGRCARHWREGPRVVRAALARHGAAASHRGDVTAILCEGQLTFRLGEIAAARRGSSDALALARDWATAARGRRAEQPERHRRSRRATTLRRSAARAGGRDQPRAREHCMGDDQSRQPRALFISEGSFAAAAAELERVLAFAPGSADTFAEATPWQPGCSRISAAIRGGAIAFATDALAICRRARAPAVEVDQLNLLAADTAPPTGDMARRACACARRSKSAPSSPTGRASPVALRGSGALAVRLGACTRRRPGSRGCR